MNYIVFSRNSLSEHDVVMRDLHSRKTVTKNQLMLPRFVYYIFCLFSLIVQSFVELYCVENLFFGCTCNCELNSQIDDCNTNAETLYLCILLWTPATPGCKPGLVSFEVGATYHYDLIKLLLHIITRGSVCSWEFYDDK